MTHPARACETCGVIAEGNTWAIGGLDKAADWWKQSITYKDGKYLTVEEAFR